MTSSRRATRTAASLIVECLEAEGCRWVFSVPGEETLALLDALSRSASVRHITTRHEQDTLTSYDDLWEPATSGGARGRDAISKAYPACRRWSSGKEGLR